MISWTTYAMWLGLGLVIYYAVVVFFFKAKGSSILRVKRKAVEKKAVDDVLFKGKPTAQESTDVSTMAPVHSLVDELQALVNQAGEKKMEKDELSDRLKTLLNKYPGTKGSIYQNGITNLIEVIAEDQCGIHFSAEELSAMWDE